MSVPTVAVTVKIFDAAGNPCADGTVVSAKLDQNDVYQGMVVAGDINAVTTAGIAVLHLFPNNPETGLGTTGSIYTFRAHPAGMRSVHETAQVPNNDCTLDAIRDSVPIGSLTAAQAAQASAAAAAGAAGASATAAAGSAAAAAGSASAAATSATNAGNSATAAAGSAAAASASATSASDSAAAAAGSASTASTAATNASNSETAAAGSAAAAGTAATNAGNSATSAAGSSIAAAGSATSAAGSAANALASASSATNSAAAAAASAASATASAASAGASRTAIDNHIYPGTYAGPPVTRPDASPCQEGDMCYRSDLQHMTVLRGSGWVDYEALAQASATAAAASAALAQTARDLAQGYLLASQMLAAGTRVSEHPPFTGGGPWQMTVNVVAVMDVFVDGRKLARTDWTASAAAQPLVTNTSGEFINAQSQVCIQYV